MMAENVANIVSGSNERVAYDLCIRIANSEAAGGSSLKREQMLRLYAQCLQTVANGRYSEPSGVT